MNYPLISLRGDFPFHPYAMILHEFTAEAQAQGKAFTALNYIYENVRTLLPPRPETKEDYEAKQDQLRAKLVELSPQLVLDANAVKASLEDHRHQKLIMQHLNEGRKLGITGTPTIFVNGKLSRPSGSSEDEVMQNFQQIIDGIVAKPQ